MSGRLTTFLTLADNFKTYLLKIVDINIEPELHKWINNLDLHNMDQLKKFIGWLCVEIKPILIDTVKCFEKIILQAETKHPELFTDDHKQEIHNFLNQLCSYF